MIVLGFLVLAGAATAAVVLLSAHNQAETSSNVQPAAGETKVMQPADTKPVETKPVETKAVESKPVETIEAKPAQSVDTKPVDTKPVDTKPVATKTVETKPVVKKPEHHSMKKRPAKPTESGSAKPVDPDAPL
jgi:ribonuclease E